MSPRPFQRTAREEADPGRCPERRPAAKGQPSKLLKIFFLGSGVIG
jgi:hypothetical protein